jgi:hypothetical protein
MTKLLIKQKQNSLPDFRKYWLDNLTMACQIQEFDREINRPTKDSWGYEVDLAVLFANYQTRMTRGNRHAIKTSLQYFEELKQVVPNLTVRETPDSISTGRGIKHIVRTMLGFPSLDECRKYFNELIPGIEQVWIHKEALQQVQGPSQPRLDDSLDLESFRCPFPEDFYGYNIKQFVQERTFPIVSEAQYLEALENQHHPVINDNAMNCVQFRLWS